MYTYLALTVLLLGTLAAVAMIGRHVGQILAAVVLLFLAVTTSHSMPLTWTRRLARTSAIMPSPSAALVLY